MSTKRKRRVKAVSDELLTKAREAALAAVQIYNNPLISFKAELFIVSMVIAWTYLLHAFYRKNRVEYRYFKQVSKRRSFDRTKGGAYRYWELERCLNDEKCPIDGPTQKNLRFLIGIRHEIEHQMTTRIDAALSAKFQACCLNFNHFIKKLYGSNFGIDRHLSFSLQFSSISREQVDQLTEAVELPRHISSYVREFEAALTEEQFNSQEFAYRVLFIAKTANRKGQADQVIEFVKADSPLATEVNKTYAVIKETERPKFTANDVVRRVRDEGYTRFRMHEHTQLWKQLDAKAPAKGWGVTVAKVWYWYDTWLSEVKKHCSESGDRYK